MTVIEVNNSDDYKKHTSEGCAVVDFSAEWCGPCRRIEPIFKELAKKNKLIKFLHIDIDEASETMPNEMKDIDSVPTFHFYKDGKIVNTVLGADLKKIKDYIGKLNGDDSEKKEGEEEKKDEKEEEQKEKEEKKEAGSSSRSGSESDEKKPSSSSRTASESDETKKKKDEKDDEAAATSEKKSEEKDEKEKEKEKEKKEEKPKSRVNQIEKGEEYKKLTASKAVVDFSAEWCGPCKKIAPFFDKLADNFPNINFIRIDIDEVDDDMKDVMKTIRSVPTFYFYRDGKVVEKFSGSNPHKLLEACEKLEAEEEKKEEKKEKEKDDEEPEVKKSKEPTEAEEQRKKSSSSSSSSGSGGEEVAEKKKEEQPKEEEKKEVKKEEEKAAAKTKEEEKEEEKKVDEEKK